MDWRANDVQHEIDSKATAQSLPSLATDAPYPLPIYRSAHLVSCNCEGGNLAGIPNVAIRFSEMARCSARCALVGWPALHRHPFIGKYAPGSEDHCADWKRGDAHWALRHGIEIPGGQAYTFVVILLTLGFASRSCYCVSTRTYGPMMSAVAFGCVAENMAESVSGQ